MSAQDVRQPALPSPFDVEPRSVAGPLGPVAWYTAGSGEPVVLVHAIDAAASAMEIKPLFDGLRHGRQVITFDLPGFGRSARPRARYRPEHMQQALRRVMDEAVPTGPVDVVALSLPGQYVVREALTRPERFRRLVLIGPTGVGRHAAGPDGAFGHALERWFQSPVIGDVIFGGLTKRRVIDWYMDRTVADPASLPEAARRYAWRTAHQPGARWAPTAFLSGLLDVPGIADAYRQLSQPVLMIFGEDPRFADPAAMTQAMADQPAIRVTEVADTRDLPHWERPQQTLDLIERFLAL